MEERNTKRLARAFSAARASPIVASVFSTR